MSIDAKSVDGASSQKRKYLRHSHLRGGIGILNEWQFTRFTVCAPLLFSTTRIKLKWELERGSKLKPVSGQILPAPPTTSASAEFHDTLFYKTMGEY